MFQPLNTFLVGPYSNPVVVVARAENVYAPIMHVYLREPMYDTDPPREAPRKEGR